MNLLERFRNFVGMKKAEITEIRAETVLEKRRMKLSETLRARLDAMDAPREAPDGPRRPVRTVFDLVPYTPPKNVCPASHVVAMDAQVQINGWEYANFSGSGFPGFPYLSELAQLTEYRDMSERVAAEMTRKWIKVRSKSDKDRSKEIEQIEDEMKRLRLRDLFRQVAEKDGLFGRCQLFIDLGQDSGPELAKPLLVDKMKIAKGRLRALKLVEPMTTYPRDYNSVNPLSQDYYNPTSWYVYGQTVHASRLLTFTSRPLPDILKPAYNFSGMSLSQLAQPYVDYWYSTRNSVGMLLRNFSTSILKTNMQDALTGGGGGELIARAKLFSKLRDNQGLFLLDNESEDFVQVNTPLGGLSQLQGQAQEHMAAVAKTPLVVLLGVTPSGLNASSDGEIRVFYDYVAEQQEKLFRPNLEILFKVMQLNLFGEVYEDITFDFVSLFALSDTEKSSIRSSDVTAGVALIGAGVIDAKEERERLAKNPDSGYDNLDLSKVIEKPVPPQLGGNQQNPGKKPGEPGKQPDGEEDVKGNVAKLTDKLPKLTEKVGAA